MLEDRETLEWQIRTIRSHLESGVDGAGYTYADVDIYRLNRELARLEAKLEEIPKGAKWV